MTTITTPRFSLFENARAKLPNEQTLTLADAAEIIKNPTPQALHETERLINLRAGGTRESDQYAYCKASLPHATFGGVYKRRRRGGLDTPSGLVVLDIDCAQDAAGLRDRLAEDTYTALAFVSGGGDGVKIVVWVDPVPSDTERYESARRLAAMTYEARHGIEINRPILHVGHLCPLSPDPDVRLCLRAMPLHWSLIKTEEV